MRKDVLARQAYDAAQEARESRAVAAQYAHNVMRRATLDAEKLTRSATWNAYLEQVEALNEDDCKQLESLQAELEAPEFRNAEKCQETQFKCALLIARVQARNECIDIPKRLQGPAREAPERA